MVATTILIVEDECVIRLMLVGELEDAGYIVVEAENADQAIEALGKRTDIGLVITDVRMPGSIDGLGLAKWMSEHRVGLPLIITSGFVDASEVHSLNPAIVRVISKPYSADEAVKWVEDACADHHGDSRDLSD